MRRKVTVYGTSLLAPGNRHWSELASDYEIEFAEYGSWRTAFMEGDPLLEKSDTVIWVLFFEDLITFSSLSTLSENHDFAGITHAILKPIRQYLVRNGNKIIVAYSKLGLEMSPVPELSKRTNVNTLAAQALEYHLLQMKKEFSQLYVYPLDLAFSDEGYKHCVDYRNYYAARSRLTGNGIKILAQNLAYILNRIFSPRKKMLVLDCDNTLWGGILGEVLIEGIKIGQDGMGSVYSDFQYVIKKLAREGILLAIASKNNYDDVMQVLEKHPCMVLKKGDFASIKVNWNEKTENIYQISRELGLGLDSFVLWDDNPMEREMARLKLPELTVIEPDSDISQWPLQLKMYPGFSQFEITEEDRNKAEQYKVRAVFTSHLENRMDKKSYLQSIQMRPTSYDLSEATLQRAFQLCEKTNQFNLRTVRHSLEDLREFMGDVDSTAMITQLTDKFGDHGLVGLSIVRQANNPQTAFLDTFLLSCRVIGRCLESWMLHEVIKKLRTRKIEYLLAEFIPSGKNGPAEFFLTEHGFGPVRDSENHSHNLHSINLKKACIPNHEIFTNE